MEMLRRIWCDDSGQDLAEYGLILALIVLVASFAVFQFGESLESFWSRISGSVSAIEEPLFPES